MTTQTLHPLAAAYLDRLREAARRLPRGRREELVDEIRSHLLESLAVDAGEAEVRSVLDRLGDPAEIVDAEQPGATVAADPRGTREWAAIILLLLGGFAVGIGWIAGLILLWGSRAWTTTEKLIGTLVIPGGLATGTWALVVLGARSGQLRRCYGYANGPLHCSPAPGMSLGDYVTLAIGIVLLVAPFATAVFLARRAAQRTRDI
jgi:uncharacterized membrane protein